MRRLGIRELIERTVVNRVGWRRNDPMTVYATVLPTTVRPSAREDDDCDRHICILCSRRSRIALAYRRDPRPTCRE